MPQAAGRAAPKDRRSLQSSGWQQPPCPNSVAGGPERPGGRTMPDRENTDLNFTQELQRYYFNNRNYILTDLRISFIFQQGLSSAS
jgi:hypothetical protein